MADNRRNLRLELKSAQRRIAHLEAQLSEYKRDSPLATIGSNSSDSAEHNQVHETIRRYTQRLEILHKIDLGLIEGGSIQALIGTTLTHLRELIPYRRADVTILDETAGEAVIFAVGFNGDTTLGQGVRVPIPPNVFEGYDERHMRVFDDIRPFQDTQPRARRLANEGLVCALSAVLMDRERPIGTFGLFADTPGFFTIEYQEIATQIASQLSIAIRQLRLSEALARDAVLLEKRVVERTAELQSSKERVEAILDNSADGILVAHTDLKIQQTNSAFNRLFACKADDYFGQPLIALVLVEDAELVTTYIERVIARQSEQTIEVHACRKDRTVFDAELSVGVIKNDGLVCAFRDITERKKAQATLSLKLREEQEFQRYLKELHDITLELTRIARLDDFYRRAIELGRERLNFDRLALFLYDKEGSAAIGTYGTDEQGTITDEHHIQFVPSATGIMLRAFQRSERFAYEESVQLFSAMKPVGLGWNAAAILWNGAQSLGWLVADNALSHKPVSKPLLDILGLYALTLGSLLVQKKAQDALIQALDKEKELNELKSRFVSMASHEFRTPLASILALTETLSAYRHKLPDEQIERRLGKIQEQVGHLKDIMEDVLLLARMQARRVEFNPVILNLDALCRSVLDEFRSQPTVTHPIDYVCDEALQEVRLDRKLMRQVISNLVSNAIKYSSADKAIVVRLERNTPMLILTVHDEGIGIPETDLEHLFEPFHRASNVRAISGTGLGLVIVKESVELHGGTITVESEVGKGTTFTIRIPVINN